MKTPAEPDFENTRSRHEARVYNSRRFRSRTMRELDEKERKLASLEANKTGTRARVLDIPCGSGRIIREIKGVNQICAFDYDHNMLHTARENCPVESPVEFSAVNAACLPVKAKTMDLVICMRLMHHIQTRNDVKRVLAELSRVSRNRVIISFYRKESLKYLKQRMRGRRLSGYHISLFFFTTLAKNHGLKLKNIHFLKRSQTLAVFEKTPRPSSLSR